MKAVRKFGKKVIGSLAVLSALLITACSDSETTTTTDSNSPALAVLAVSSPTAGSSSDSASLYARPDLFFALVSQSVLNFINPVHSSRADGEDVAPELSTFDDAVAAVESAAEGEPADVAEDLANFTVVETSTYPLCYGPGWTDDADGGSSHNRPTGDLGMVSADATTSDSTACAAAKLNALISGAPQFANRLILLQAMMIATMSSVGEDLPSGEGDSVDETDNLPEITGVTITSATLERLADDSDGYAVYKTRFDFVDTDDKEGYAILYHSPLNAENTNFKGLIQAVLPYTATMGGVGTHRGLSMVYSQVDSVLKYALDIAANRSTDTEDFFGDNGRIDFTKSAFGEDGNRIIAEFDSSTNRQTMHYAWQAGQSDDASRAFAVQIDEGDEGSLSGRGYFGFGDDISELSDDVSTIWPERMFCNWIVGLAAGASVAKVQAQSFSQNDEGVYAAETSNISFAPTNTCTRGTTYTITGNSNFNTGAHPAVESSDDDFLVEVGALGDVESVEAPEFTLPE